MEFVIEKCAILITKSGKRQITEGIELLNQERIKTLGEMENYKYRRILKADTIKQAKMKGKIRKEYLRRPRNFSKQISAAKFIKGIKTWVIPLCKINGVILKMDNERTQTNKAEDKKVHDDAQGLISGR